MMKFGVRSVKSDNPVESHFTDPASPSAPPRPPRAAVREFVYAKIGMPLLEQLRQGLTPEKIALTLACGLCIAVIPVVGVTTILSFATAWALGLNQPIIQAINWFSYALQLLLIVPFIRMGERIFRAPRLTLSIDELVTIAKVDPFGALAQLWTTLWHAVAAWAIVVPFAGALVFFASWPLFRSLARRVAAARGKQMHDVA
jgi:hypothetical protein